MAKARVTEVRGLGANSAFAKAVEDAAAEQVMKLLQETADDAARRADVIVSREFNNTRSADRRRRGGQHLLGSFVGKAERTSAGGLIGQVVLTSKAAPVKVRALNYGSAPHLIGADGRKLAFPRSETGGQYKKSAKFFRSRQAAGDKGSKLRVVKGPVEHPGTLGSHFLERALEQAVRARLKTTVIIPRGE